VRSQVTQQAFIFVLDLRDNRHGDDCLDCLGHRYLRLGLGLGLFLPAHFLQQGPLRFWVVWAGRAAGRAARR
jgi:hypothetical protein